MGVYSFHVSGPGLFVHADELAVCYVEFLPVRVFLLLLLRSFVLLASAYMLGFQSPSVTPFPRVSFLFFTGVFPCPSPHFFSLVLLAWGVVADGGPLRLCSAGAAGFATLVCWPVCAFRSLCL